MRKTHRPAKASKVEALKAQDRLRRSLHPGKVIRDTRRLLGWKSIDLARRAGINPQTANAIEIGRIKNPALKSLEAMAHALGLSMAALFSNVQPPAERTMVVHGNQKGHHTLEFPKAGFRIICYLPFLADLFIGKVVVSGGTAIEHNILPTRGFVFVQAIIGKLGVRISGEDHLIREGHYLFFDAGVPHGYFNPQMRESTFLLTAVPSFLSASGARARREHSSRNKKRR